MGRMGVRLSRTYEVESRIDARGDAAGGDHAQAAETHGGTAGDILPGAGCSERHTPLPIDANH